MKFTKAIAVRYAAFFVFLALIVECLFFGYFLTRVYQGTSLFLIGNDKILDNLIKARLVYSVYFSQGKKYFLFQADNDLGYTLGKDKEAGLYKTNKQGFRADREYPLIPPEDTLRVAVFGDSYVFGDGEKNEGAWPSILEHLAGHLEVLNFGVSGYGLGQSYLRYLKDGLRFKPDIVLINYAGMGPRDDFNRREIAGRGNLREAHLYRVHFFLKDGALVTKTMTPFDLFDPAFRKEFLFDEDEIFKKAGMGFIQRSSFCYTGLFVKERVLGRLLAKERFEESQGANQEINLKLLEDFIKITRENGTKLVFYSGSDFKEIPDGAHALFKKYPNVVYANSSDLFDKQVRIHKAIGVRLRNASDHHNAEGNKFHAMAVLELLKGKTWGEGDRIFQFDKNSNAFIHIKK